MLGSGAVSDRVPYPIMVVILYARAAASLFHLEMKRIRSGSHSSESENPSHFTHFDVGKTGADNTVRDA